MTATVDVPLALGVAGLNVALRRSLPESADEVWFCRPCSFGLVVGIGLASPSSGSSASSGSSGPSGPSGSTSDTTGCRLLIEFGKALGERASIVEIADPVEVVQALASPRIQPETPAPTATDPTLRSLIVGCWDSEARLLSTGRLPAPGEADSAHVAALSSWAVTVLRAGEGGSGLILSSAGSDVLSL